jgi:hypothetical protein
MFSFDIINLEKNYSYVSDKLDYIYANYSTDISTLTLNNYLDIFQYLKNKYDIYILLFIDTEEYVSIPSYINMIYISDINLKTVSLFLKNIDYKEYGLILFNSYDIYLNSKTNKNIIYNIDNIKQIQHLVALINYNKIYWGSVNNMDVITNVITTQKHMYLRIGIVELNIINFFKKNKETLFDIYQKYSHIMTDHHNNLIYDILNDTNINKDIKMLLRTTTNAGFYITDKANNFDELEYCLNKYLEGYNNCDGFLRCDGCLLSMTELNEQIKPNYTIYIEKDIYKIIKNKNVLIISPFSEQINSQIKSGNYKDLFKDENMNNFLLETYENCNLYTLNIPITIYGNPVHNSWKQTFQITCDKIKEFIKDTNIDLVIPSCGFYGIPLCNYVYTQLEISSLYYGNAIHQLFGLMQNDFNAFPKNIINDQKWIAIDTNIINSISNNNSLLMDNLKKIDIKNGRYVLHK